jgi:hypothetical protein
MMPASWMTTVPEMVKVTMAHCWYSLVDDSLSQNCHALKAPDDESKCQLKEGIKTFKLCFFFFFFFGEVLGKVK